MLLGGALQRGQSFCAQLRCEGISAVIERIRIDVNAHDLLQHIAHRLGITRMPRALRQEHVPCLSELLVPVGAAHAPSKQVTQRSKGMLLKHTA